MLVEYAGRGGSCVSWVRPMDEQELLQTMTDDTTILQVEAGTASRFFPGIYCVSMCAQVTGVPSCALSPDGFYRDCIAHGATLVDLNTTNLGDVNG